MSLERQDVRAKLDPDMKWALQAICDARGITEAEFKRLVHEASVITERLHGRGTTGKNRDWPGAAGIGGGR